MTTRPGIWSAAGLLICICACTQSDNPPTADPGLGDAGTPDAIARLSAVGGACATAADCGGLPCATEVTRACEGPIRPHAWAFAFAGGSCTPTTDFDTGTTEPCPSDGVVHTVLTGCDGIRFRFCASRCASDGDCRGSDGYFCQPEALICLPPSLRSE